MAVDRTERLLNLVLCLLGSPRAVPRAMIRASVPGYTRAASDEAFERMFERDKEELRGMGVPVDTVSNSAGEVEGYRIDSSDYALPDITLTAEELTVLGLAAQAWSDAALTAPALAALRKVEAVTGVRGDIPGTTWRSAGVQAGESELPVLWEAIRTRHSVAFDYLALGDTVASRREVDPWATVRWQGGWYLACWNPERDQARVYRLSRIQGSVQRLDRTFAPVDPGNVRELVSRLASPEPTGTAIVQIPPGRGVALRQRGIELSDGRWSIPYVVGDQLLSEALSSGAVVESPEELVLAARAALERVRALHSTGGEHA